VELIHSGSNSRFDMGVVFTVNYSCNVSVDSETLLVTDFVNLKIKSAQSFRCAHRDRLCVRVFVGVSAREYLCLYCIFKKRFNGLKYFILSFLSW
jgi:hypothetical protein